MHPWSRPLLSGCAAVLLLAAFAAPSHAYRLVLLHNNDAESKLLGFPTGPTVGYGAIAPFVTKANDLRAAASTPGTGVVFLTSGDMFLAGPEFDASLVNGVPYYDAIGLEEVGYDVMAIGNHEFDFGPDVLEDWISSFASGVPFLSANLDFSGEPGLAALVASGRIKKSHVLVKEGVEIGIVGATTPRLPYISSPRNVVVDPDVAGVVQAEVDALTAAGVKIIIFISHLQNINEDVALLAQLRGIDIAVAGGGSEVLANAGDLLVPGQVPYAPYPLNATDLDGNTVPIVTTEGDYFYVGRLTVDFDADGNLVDVIESESGPVRVTTLASQPDAVVPDASVVANVTTPVQAHVSGLAAQLIGITEVALEGRRPIVRTVETNLGNLIADAFLWQGEQLAPGFGAPMPDVAIQNGGGIRNNSILPAGDLSELNTFQVLSFANYFCIVPGITPQNFKEILENAVSAVENTDGRFAQIAGFRFTYDPNGMPQRLDLAGNVTQPGQRVIDVVLDDGTVICSNGMLVPGAPPVNIATIDFLANGGDQYPFRGVPFFNLGVSYQQAFSNYIQQGLGGRVSAARYPAGGEGRITRFDPTPVLPGNRPTPPAAVAFSFRALGSLDGRPRFDFALPAAASVELALYSVSGQRVGTLVDQPYTAGSHSLTWDGRFEDGRAAPAGVYFARLAAGKDRAERKFVLAR
jgi:5'-nucleotidase